MKNGMKRRDFLTTACSVAAMGTMFPRTLLWADTSKPW